MNRIFKAATFLTVLFVAACNTVQIVNVEDRQLAVPPSTTMKQVESAILAGGRQLGWVMEPQSPGKIKGTLRLRTHVAVVDIVHSTQAFSIRYRDSTNLHYDGTNIHRNYNGWVGNLENSIISHASTLQ